MIVTRNPYFINNINNFNLEIIDSGYACGDKSWKQKNIVSPFSRFYFIESGEAIIKSAAETIVMKPGYVYLVPTGYRFSYSCNDYYTKLFFHFNINKLDGYDALADLRKFYSVNIGISEVQKLIKFYDKNDNSGSLYIKKYLYNLLYDMVGSEELDVTYSQKYSPVMQKAIRYISSHLSLHFLSAKEICENLYISETTLSKYFKEEMGITVKKYIDDQIFYAVEKTLLKTNWPLGKISDSFGFCDQFYFSRRFKQRYGCTPTQYRKAQSWVI